MGRCGVDAVTTLPDGLPEFTLGDGVLAWCDHYVRQPDGQDVGAPWQFTPEQARFVLWWYAVDSRGRWRYNRGVLRRSKGWGKSPIMAALSLAELCGPVRVDYFDDAVAGGVVGKPEPLPWVQLAGVSEKQTDNTMSLVLAMINESPIIHDYGLDAGLTRTYTATGGKLVPITASAPTAEGARPTFCVADETHWWTASNGGWELDRVNRRNVSKVRGGTGRVLETTNAHETGLESVAEKSYKAWRKAAESGRATGLLYDSREAPAGVDLTDRGEVSEALAAAYGDSTWVDLDRLADELYDLSTPPEDSRRYYLNQVSDAEDAAVAEHDWAGCADAAKVIADGDLVVLGFDGSRGRRSGGKPDATALIGCRVEDGHIFEIGVWEAPDGPGMEKWQPPLAEIEAAIAGAFARWHVAGFHADPATNWRSHVNKWEAEYGRTVDKRMRVSPDHPFEWWMLAGRSGLVNRATQEFLGAIEGHDLTHDGSFALTRHVLNARRRMRRGQLRLGKDTPDSPRKIDATIAALLAWDARGKALALGLTTTTSRRSRRLAY